MEKPARRSKKKLWKAVQAAVSFQNLPFSPRGDNRADSISFRLKTHHNKGFSGPIPPMIPAEARRKPKNFEYQEPTSPKVSCMGQIKHRKPSLPNELKPGKIKKLEPTGSNPEMIRKKNFKSGIKEIVFGSGRKPGPSIDQARSPIRGAAPSLIQTRKFASSRDGLASFDWTAAQIAPAEDREYYSDGEGEFSDGEDGVINAFSVPVMVARAGLDSEPRKEINLWSRRTMARLKPLELNKDKEI